MRKVIKKYGNATVINLTKDDLKCFNLKEGYVVEIVIGQVWPCEPKKKTPKPGKTVE